MNSVLLGTGLACIIAAVVGGGLRGFGLEIPALQSIKRQLLLAVLGVLPVGGAAVVDRPPGSWPFDRNGSKDTATSAARTQPQPDPGVIAPASKPADAKLADASIAPRAPQPPTGNGTDRPSKEIPRTQGADEPSGARAAVATAAATVDGALNRLSVCRRDAGPVGCSTEVNRLTDTTVQWRAFIVGSGRPCTGQVTAASVKETVTIQCASTSRKYQVDYSTGTIRG